MRVGMRSFFYFCPRLMIHVKQYIYWSVVLIMAWLSVVQPLFAQQSEEVPVLVQVTGEVLDAENQQPIVFANVHLKHHKRAMLTNNKGMFVLVGRLNEEIVISSVGYQNCTYKISAKSDINNHHLHVVLHMKRDTIELPETTVYGFPTYEEMKHIFLTMESPTQQQENEAKMFDAKMMQQKWDNLPASPSMTYRRQVQETIDKAYYAGQYRPISLLNPMAWVQFFKMISGNK